jgi:hypothetical protein
VNEFITVTSFITLVLMNSRRIIIVGAVAICVYALPFILISQIQELDDWLTGWKNHVVLISYGGIAAYTVKKVAQSLLVKEGDESQT